MTKDETLKMALEALENAEYGDYDKKELNEAITAIKEVLAQPEQEPVAWLHTKIEGVVVPHRPADLSRHPDRWEALYRTPPPCPTCEALARTVMLDQTYHDNISPQRKPLTDEEITQLIFWSGGRKTTQNLMSNPMQVREHIELWNQHIYKFARAIEAAHGIKE